MGVYSFTHAFECYQYAQIILDGMFQPFAAAVTLMGMGLACSLACLVLPALFRLRHGSSRLLLSQTRPWAAHRRSLNETAQPPLQQRPGWTHGHSWISVFCPVCNLSFLSGLRLSAQFRKQNKKPRGYQLRNPRRDLPGRVGQLSEGLGSVILCSNRPYSSGPSAGSFVYRWHLLWALYKLHVAVGWQITPITLWFHLFDVLVRLTGIGGQRDSPALNVVWAQFRPVGCLLLPAAACFNLFHAAPPSQSLEAHLKSNCWSSLEISSFLPPSPLQCDQASGVRSPHNCPIQSNSEPSPKSCA